MLLVIADLVRENARLNSQEYLGTVLREFYIYLGENLLANRPALREKLQYTFTLLGVNHESFHSLPDKHFALGSRRYYERMKHRRLRKHDMFTYLERMWPLMALTAKPFICTCFEKFEIPAAQQAIIKSLFEVKWEEFKNADHSVVQPLEEYQMKGWCLSFGCLIIIIFGGY